MNDRNKSNDTMLLVMIEVFTDTLKKYGPELSASQFVELISGLARVHHKFHA